MNTPLISPDAIIVKNLIKKFKEGKEVVTAVNNISFSVKKGEIFGLLGPNGAGKSTTLNILNGLISKDSGVIKILGFEPEENWEYVKNRINVSTAYYSLSELLTIKQNLIIYARLYGLRKETIEPKINELLTLFELQHLKDRKVIQLSSGEKTRVSLCKGFINDPEVLFLDECTVGLDPDIAEKTRMIIKNYQKKNNTTIVFTSHYMAEVEQLCDRIAFMNHGEILKIDTADNFKKMITKNTVDLSIKENYTAVKRILKERKAVIVSSGKISKNQKEEKISFEISSTTDELYKIMNLLFQAGVKISDMHVTKATLEDIFIHYSRTNKKMVQQK